MHRVFKRVVFLLVIAVSVALMKPQSLKAVDNHELGDDSICTVTINGNLASIYNEGLLPVYSLNQSTQERQYDVDVDLPQNLQDYVNQCNATLRIANKSPSQITDTWGKELLTYADGGRYSASFSHLLHSTTQQFDVEIESSPGNICSSGTPICRRVYAKFAPLDSLSTDRNSSECLSQIQEVEQAVSQIPRTFSVIPAIDGNTSASSIPFSLDVDGPDDFIWRACGLSSISYTTQNKLGGGQRTIAISPDDADANLYIFPSQIGQYTLRVNLNYSNGGTPSVLKNILSSFCVHGSTVESCVVEDPVDENLKKSSTPYNVCNQIATLTDAQIDSQVSRYTSPSQIADVRESLRERRDKLADEKARCCLCATGDSSFSSTDGQCSNRVDDVRGVYTALGCFPATTDSIIQQLVLVGLSIAGSVALLMILSGAFMLTTSQGEPKRAGEAKEMITSAVMGLLFIIFSVTILQFIGVNILRIPGFGAPL